MTFTNILKQVQVIEARKNFCMVMFSGGLDSTVLLHVVRECFLKSNRIPHLLVVHVNHGLSENAESWSKHCADLCDALGVSFKLLTVQCVNNGAGLEAAARDARYHAILALARIYQKHTQLNIDILTGHHANDQLETLLFRQFRGTGPAGLKGIPTQRRVTDNITIFRPFLYEPYCSLEEYAQHFKLDYIHDESNSDLAFDRNFIRVKLLPLIEQRWPNVQERMTKLTQLTVREQDLLETYANEDLQACNLKCERLGSSIDVSLFEQWSESRQHHVLRAWVKQKGFSPPLVHHLEQLPRFVNAALDKSPELNWANAVLKRFNKRLYLISAEDLAGIESASKHAQDSRVLSWDLSAVLELGDGFCLGLTNIDIAREKNRVDSRLLKSLQVRFRQGGERCKPLGRNHSQTLKKLLQDYCLEPWLRYRVPLVYLDDTLIAVGDLFVCESTCIDTERFKFSWSKTTS